MKSAKPILLLLEDVPELREWLRTLLEARFPDFRLRTVGSAIEFHQAIERDRPRLVILDEVLGPGEDLASLLKRVEVERIPAALMTGMEILRPQAKGLPAGVTRRMVKPNWTSGEGVEGFLHEVSEVIALTTSGPIG